MYNIKRLWMGGFVSGEGCFTFNKIYPTFIITLNLKDKNLLQMLQEELQSGKININKDYNSVSFYINGYSNCFNIIEYFDDVLLGEKKKQFDSWKKIIIKYHENYKNNKFKNNIIKQIIKMRGY